MEKRKIIVIVGPTASGKTGWGVSVASAIGRPASGWKGGEIISADSRQVYRGLNIGTGKDLEDYSDTKYHLIDICDPGVQFTMFDWVERARIVIEDIFSRGKTPIIVGGTGLYVQALVEGFQKSKIKNQNCNLKVKIFSREELESKTLKELQQINLRLNTDDLKLDLDNPHRLIRAIERAQNGEVVSKKKPNFEVLQIAIDMPREVLYQRIDQRVDEWFKEGFTEEVQSLLKNGVDPKWLEKIGLEYRLLTQYLIQNSKLKSQNCKLKVKIIDTTTKQFDSESFEEMKQKMKFVIHAYARRQLTWFRRFSDIIWCFDLKSAEKEINKFLK